MGAGSTMSKWRRLRDRSIKIDAWGTISESHHCIDCGLDTMPGTLNRAEAEASFLVHACGTVVSFVLIELVVLCRRYPTAMRSSLRCRSRCGTCRSNSDLSIRPRSFTSLRARGL